MVHEHMHLLTCSSKDLGSAMRQLDRHTQCQRGAMWRVGRQLSEPLGAW